MTFEEKGSLHNEMVYTNIKRARIFSMALIVLHLFLLIIDIHRLLSGEFTENIGYRYLYYLHLLLIIGLLFIYILLSVYRVSSPQEITKAHRVLFMGFSCLILFVAGAVASVDQLLHGQITAYIIALLIYGVAVYLWFFQRLILFTIAHTLFMVGISFFQKDDSILLGHYVNGLLIFFVALTLSQVLFQSFKISYRDNQQRQKAQERLTTYAKDIENLYQQLDHELDKARQVHNHILPSSFPEINGISFHTFYHPAERIGGDFYDVLKVQNRLVFYLSDVSGHGLDSAMLNVFVKHTIKGFLSFSPLGSITPANIVRYLAEQFKQEKYPDEYFICLFIGVLDLETMVFTYSGAGFQDALLVSTGDGHRQKLFSKGLFVTSYFPTTLLNLEEEEIHLTPGTTLFINTDGLTEQRSSTSLYRDRLSQVFFDHANETPHHITEAIVEDFREFSNGSLESKDDITFLVMQVHRENS